MLCVKPEHLGKRPVSGLDYPSKLYGEPEDSFLRIKTSTYLNSSTELLAANWPCFRFFELPETSKMSISRSNFNSATSIRYRGYFPVDKTNASHKEGNFISAGDFVILFVLAEPTGSRQPNGHARGTLSVANFVCQLQNAPRLIW